VSSRHGERFDAPVEEPEKALRLMTESGRLETHRREIHASFE
jgi:hypothetical protein